MPAGNLLFLEKLPQHGVGSHTGKEGGRESRRTAIPQVTETKQGGGHHGQTPGPSGGLDGLPHHQPQGNENEQAQKRPEQVQGQALDGVGLQLQPTPANHQKGEGQGNRQGLIGQAGLRLPHDCCFSWQGSGSSIPACAALMFECLQSPLRLPGSSWPPPHCFQACAFLPGHP